MGRSFVRSFAPSVDKNSSLIFHGNRMNEQRMEVSVDAHCVWLPQNCLLICWKQEQFPCTCNS